MTFKTLKILLAVVAVASFLPLTACNTIEGIGHDTKAAGQAISGSSRDVRK